MGKKRSAVRQYDTKGFGWRVMTERKKLGLTQFQVVQSLKRQGVATSVAALSELERGDTKRIRLAMVKALSSALQVDVSRLFEDTGDSDHASM